MGIKCHTAEKEGKTAGELSGGPARGVRATRDSEKLLASDADCVIYMPRDTFADPSLPNSSAETWVAELEKILVSGKSVVTSLTAGTHYRHLQHGELFVERLNAACARGDSSVLFTGFDPGFSDILAFTMSGAVGEITQIRTWEIVDYSLYTVPETLSTMGYGTRPEDLPAGAINAVRTTWGGVPYLMGDALGIIIEELKIDAEFYLSPKTFTAPGGLLVREGTIGALRFSVTGIISGKPIIAVHHVTRIGQDMAPNWPTIGHDGGYRVEIDSFPPFTGEFPMGIAGGTGSALADAMAMTAARCVNCVEAITQAAPGYTTYLNLWPIGGRYAVRI